MISWAKTIIQRVSRGRAGAAIKERLIDLSTMSGGLKMVVYVSYAALAAIAILTVFHGWLAKTKIISVIILDFPTGVLIAATPILFLALTLVLTGLMLSNPKLRYWTIGLIALLLLMVAHSARNGILLAPDSFVQGRLPVAVLIPLFESAAIILLATALFIRKLRPVAVAALCGGSLLVLLGLSVFITLSHDPVFGPGLMVVILILFVLSLGGPALITVGVDLAEWALLLGGSAGDALHPEKWHAGVLLTCVWSDECCPCHLGAGMGTSSDYRRPRSDHSRLDRVFVARFRTAAGAAARYSCSLLDLCWGLVRCYFSPSTCPCLGLRTPLRRSTIVIVTVSSRSFTPRDGNPG